MRLTQQEKHVLRALVYHERKEWEIRGDDLAIVNALKGIERKLSKSIIKKEIKHDKRKNRILV